MLLDKNLLEHEDLVISVDLALYEVANSIWKHQFLFKDLKEGLQYISLLLDMVNSGLVALVRPDFELMKSAYEIAGTHRITIYDSIFLALALETGLELKSSDRKMMALFNSKG